MRGLMMDTPLLISSILRFAERNFPDREIVSVTVDEPRHRYRYADCFSRARRLANALARLGAQPGDRVGTLAWNDYRHLELYYAVSGSGLVCHTINPRLYPEQIAFIVNHAEDRWLFVDPTLLPLVEKLKPKLGGVERIVVLTDSDHRPETALADVVCYEDLIGGESDEYRWPVFDENAASTLCYTSGTTGDPKGVLYSHRSTLLHAYAGCMPDVLSLSGHDCALAIVPMFHVNAWGIPYSTLMVGAKLVLPGPKMGDGPTLQQLIHDEGVTVASGVPTVWLALLGYLAESGKPIDSLRRVSVGGAACPRSIIEAFRDRYGITVHQGWGMTETSPLGTIFNLKPGMEDLDRDQVAALQTKQGRGVFGVEMKIVDPEGRELPWDGEAFGALKVRGPWVCGGYYRLDESPSHDADGWFDTGDVATIDADGFMQITDRTKDVIKSGGEWISSIALENTAVDHPDVVEAAVIGRPHPKWSERPLLIVVPRPGAELDRHSMLEWFDGKVAKWWLPDDVQFVDELPHTATGKLNKLALRARFQDYQFPDS